MIENPFFVGGLIDIVGIPIVSVSVTAAIVMRGTVGGTPSLCEVTPFTTLNGKI